MKTITLALRRRIIVAINEATGIDLVFSLIAVAIFAVVPVLLGIAAIIGAIVGGH